MVRQTVFVVDDDAAVRDSIRELVESVGLRAECHASGRSFLDAFALGRAGCVVLDVRMAEMSGLAVQDQLGELRARIPVIVITGHGDIPMAVQAIQQGAVDFIQKPYRDQQLLDSINAALAMGAAAGLDDFDTRFATLTPREREVADALLEGGTSKEIAAALGVSPRTVDVHRQNLLRKIGVGSAKELLFRRRKQERGN